MPLSAIGLLYLSSLARVFGSAAALLRRLARSDREPQLPISVTVIVDLAVVSVAAGYLSIVVQIGLSASVILLAAAAIIAFLCATS